MEAQASTPPTPEQTLAGPTSTGSKKMAIWALILGIIALLTSVLFFVSAPLAIITIILAIIILVKRKPGKRLGIVSLILGGLSLLMIPVSVLLIATAYNGISQKAAEVKESSDAKAAGKVVETDCYTYIIPTEYEKVSNSNGCFTGVNIPNGDALTFIKVSPVSGEPLNLDGLVALYEEQTAVLNKKELSVNGHVAYYIVFEDSYGVPKESYTIVDDSGKQTIEGKTVTAYTVSAYLYENELGEKIKTIIDSLDIK